MFELHITNITEVSHACPQEFLINCYITHDNGGFVTEEDFTILTRYRFGEFSVACAYGIYDLEAFPHLLFNVGAKQSIKYGTELDGSMTIIETFYNLNKLGYKFSNF